MIWADLLMLHIVVISLLRLDDWRNLVWFRPTSSWWHDVTTQIDIVLGRLHARGTVCGVILPRAKEQADRSPSHRTRADSPWSQHSVAATSTDRTALISFGRFCGRSVVHPLRSLGRLSRDDRHPSRAAPPSGISSVADGFFSASTNAGGDGDAADSRCWARLRRRRLLLGPIERPTARTGRAIICARAQPAARHADRLVS